MPEPIYITVPWDDGGPLAGVADHYVTDDSEDPPPVVEWEGRAFTGPVELQQRRTTSETDPEGQGNYSTLVAGHRNGARWMTYTIDELPEDEFDVAVIGELQLTDFVDGPESFIENNPNAALHCTVIPNADYTQDRSETPTNAIVQVVGPNAITQSQIWGSGHITLSDFDWADSGFQQFAIEMPDIAAELRSIEENLPVTLTFRFWIEPQDLAMTTVNEDPASRFRDADVRVMLFSPGMSDGPPMDNVGAHPVLRLGEGEDPDPDPDPPSNEIVCVTAHIREDRFYAIDSDGRTYVTEYDGGTSMIEGAPLPDGVEPQWRGLWRDGEIPGLLYIAGGTGGLWKSVDGFATPEGYFQMRAPGVDGSPSNAVHRRIGLHGKLQDAPQPIPEGNVYLVTASTVRVRAAADNWQTLVTDEGLPGLGDGVAPSLQQLASPRGHPERLWLRGQLLWTSEDSGQTWEQVSLPEGMGYGSIEWIFCKDYEPDSVYLAVRVNNDALAGTWRSTDGGVNWTRIIGHDFSTQGSRRGLFAGDRLYIVQNRADITFTGTYYTDNEAEPVIHTGQSSAGYFELASSHNAPSVLYTCRPNLTTSSAAWRWRQSDGGTSIPLDDPPSGRAQWMATGQANTVLMVYGTGGTADPQYLYRSTNQGDSWQLVLGPIDEFRGSGSITPRQISVSLANDEEYWAFGQNNGGGYVFYSQDDGVTWEMEHALDGTHRHIYATG